MGCDAVGLYGRVLVGWDWWHCGSAFGRILRAYVVFVFEVGAMYLQSAIVRGMSGCRVRWDLRELDGKLVCFFVPLYCIKCVADLTRCTAGLFTHGGSR